MSTKEGPHQNGPPTEIYLVEYSFTSKWDNKTHTYYKAYETLKLAKSYKTRKINKGYQNVILWAYTIIEGKREYFKQSKDDYKIVEVEIK